MHNIKYEKITLKIIAKFKINQVLLKIIYILNININLLLLLILLEKSYEILIKFHIEIKILKKEILMTNIIKKKKIF